jgi:exosortase/archaeosortase family protein
LETESAEHPFGSSLTQKLYIALALMLVVLPLVNTFNELLTSIVMRTGLHLVMERAIMPPLVRILAAILQTVFSIKTGVSSTSLYLYAGIPIEVYFDWNCLGWQSFVLFFFTLITGLQGDYTRRSKARCVATGFQAVFLINLARIVISSLLIYYWDYHSAIFFHDYLSTLVVMGWMVTFWYFAFDHYLERVIGVDADKPGMSRGVIWVAQSSIQKSVEVGKAGRFKPLKKILGPLVITFLVVGSLALPMFTTVEAKSGPSALTFEHAHSPVKVNGISTNHYMTAPDYTDLDATGGRSDCVEADSSWDVGWNFYLHGPLDLSYTLSGKLEYHMYLSTDQAEDAETRLRFDIYDVDESGSSTLIHTDTSKTIKVKPKDSLHVFKGDSVSSYTLQAGHTIRVRVSIFATVDCMLQFSYDSPDKHSFIEFPGIIVPETILPMIFVAPFVPILSVWIKRKKSGQ